MRFVFFLLLAFLLIGGIWIVFEHVSTKTSVLSAEERKTAMTQLFDRDPVLEAKGERTWRTYQGKYLSFSYPADAKVYQKNPGASVLESFSSGVTDPRINLSVQVVSGNDLAESSAVAFRRSDTKLYQEGPTSPRLRGASEQVVFLKDTSDGIEKSVFFTANGQIYSIVVSGYQMEAVEELYQKVVETIEL